MILSFLLIFPVILKDSILISEISGEKINRGRLGIYYLAPYCKGSIHRGGKASLTPSSAWMEKERLGKALTEKISVPMGVSSDTRTCFSPTTLSSSEKLHVTPETGAIGLN
jgi:hypothetical protein